MVWINNILALVWIMACRLVGANPLSEPVMVSLLTHICLNELISCCCWTDMYLRTTVALYVARHDTGNWRYDTYSALLVLCEGNPLMTGGFPSHRASNADMSNTLSHTAFVWYHETVTVHVHVYKPYTPSFRIKVKWPMAQQFDILYGDNTHHSTFSWFHLKYPGTIPKTPTSSQI